MLASQSPPGEPNCRAHKPTNFCFKSRAVSTTNTHHPGPGLSSASFLLRVALVELSSLPGCFGRSQLTARSFSPECQVQFRVRPFQQPQRCAWKNGSRRTWHIYNFSDFPQGTHVNIFRSGGDVRKFIVRDLELTLLTWFPSYSLELMENMGYQPNLLKQTHA